MVLRRTQTRNIKEIIQDLLKEYDLDEKLQQRELVRQWDDVVGHYIARSTQSVYIHDRKLFIKLRSSVVRNELMLIRQGLVDELNKRVGAKLIDEIILT